MILPPDNPKNTTAVNNLRPEGKFGIQIAIADRSLWLSGITTTDADIFRTPEEVRLGLPIFQIVAELGKTLDSSGLFGNIDKDDLERIRVDRIEFRRSKQSAKPNETKKTTFGLEISVVYGKSELRLWLMLGDTQELKLRLGNPNNPTEITVKLEPEGSFFHLKPKGTPNSFSLASVGRVVSPDLEELMGAIEISPQEMAICTHKASGNYALAFKLGVDIALSQLPFVGERLPKGADVSISELSLVWCSSTLATDKDARDYFVNNYGDKSNTPDKKCELITSEALSSGGIFSASLKVPSVESKQQLKLPFASSTKSANPAPSSTTSKPVSVASDVQPVSPSDDSATWFKVGKNVGPLSLQRIGLKYEAKKIWFLFDASLNSGSLALIVDGLGAGLDPFKLLGGHFEPAFTLRGLGLDIKGSAEVSGSLMRDRVKDPRGDYDEFSGAILIKNKTFAIAGMASYADPSWSDPTFFAYAFLDKTIGGPPCFFVTGLAIGIAINRSLDLPSIDQISQFPLVRMALGDPPTPPGSDLPTVRDTKGDSELAKLLALQQAMRPYTRPHSGQIALAVGVRFTTFKLLNSFALLVASIGKPFKLDLLISSRLEIPSLPPESKVPRIAQIGIDLRGTWIPEDGTMFVEGRIAEGSWFLDSACRLTGGAAFAAWTSGPHAGDFVMTVGGYHPKFTVPAHYPKVPRLALNFTRGAMEIKGDAYFAMTPSALMAGISLNATFTEGNFKAWFNCEADFLVAWEPFSYEATMNVEIGASYKTFLGTVRGSVGAKLQLWGPDMAGIATVDLTVIKFDVKFGAPKTPPIAIDAKAFRERFLPANDAELLSIGVSKGLVSSGTYEGVPLFVVNPADFSLAIESVIPKPDGKIGIRPMGKVALTEIEVLTWTIEKEDTKKEDTKKEDNYFIHEPVTKPVPSALWGPALADPADHADGKVRSPSFNTNINVINATVGYTIRPNEYNLIVKENTNQFPEKGQLSVFISKGSQESDDSYYACVFDKTGNKVFPNQKDGLDGKFLSDKNKDQDLRKQLNQIFVDKIINNNAEKIKLIEEIRLVLKLLPSRSKYETKIFLSSPISWSESDDPNSHDIPKKNRANPNYPTSNQLFNETDPLEGADLSLYNQINKIPSSGKNALFIAKEDEDKYYATVFDKAGRKIFPDKSNESNKNDEFFPDTTLILELEKALKNSSTMDSQKNEQLIQKIRIALGLTPVEIMLKDISNNPPKDLLAALTGECKRDFASEVSLSSDWLANLQELPHVGTLLRSAS